MNRADDKDKWEFDAPKYWDLTRPDQDSDAVDNWFGMARLLKCVPDCF